MHFVKNLDAGAKCQISRIQPSNNSASDCVYLIALTSKRIVTPKIDVNDYQSIDNLCGTIEKAAAAIMLILGFSLSHQLVGPLA